MKRTGEFVSSFNRSWKRFSEAWENTRRNASEKAVHDLRVNTRRLIAKLELARVLSNRKGIARVQRHFKKVLKRIGPLRDVQVQLDNISGMRKGQVISDFRRRLQRRESEEIQKIQSALKRDKKRRLAAEMKQLGAEVGALAALRTHFSSKVG